MTASHQLRVLIANEREDRLALLEAVVEKMGHHVVAHETDVAQVAALTARVRPDLALVGLGLSSEHALDLVSEIVRESYCPVIGILHTKDPAWVNDAAQRGLYAYIVDGRPDELQSAIDHRLAKVRGASGAPRRLRPPERRGRARAGSRHHAAASGARAPRVGRAEPRGGKARRRPRQDRGITPGGARGARVRPSDRRALARSAAHRKVSR